MTMIKIGFLSDTHNNHENLIIPECDILCISGDYTNIGAAREYIPFYNWLEKQTQVKHKVFIEGNHELQADTKEDIRQFYATAYHAQWLADLEARKDSFKEHNIHRLFNSEVVIEGIKFWGSPYTLAFYDWAFNMNADELKENWEQMPHDTDILLTHGPPLNKMDLCPNGHRAGDPWLMQKILEVRPKVCNFGHIHEQNPNKAEVHVVGEKKVLMINSAVVNDDYTMNLYQPIMVDYDIKNNIAQFSAI